MRLIDADALKELYDIMADKCDGNGESIWHQFRTTVECSPTVDAVPVIRCKDCKQCRKTILFGHFATVCDYWIKLTDDDGYCNHAERKEE